MRLVLITNNQSATPSGATHQYVELSYNGSDWVNVDTSTDTISVTDPSEGINTGAY